MMSTKMICGRWSAIFASASKPSVAVTTSAPSRRSSVSAVRRMVFESSITITRRPSRLPARLWSCVIVSPRCMRPTLRGPLRTPILQPAATVSSTRCGFPRRCPVQPRGVRPGAGTICQQLPRMVRMPLDVVVVMDPIGSIKVAKDSTFAMLLEAQRRGHRLHYVTPGGLSMDGGRPRALAAPLEVRDDASDWYTLGTAAQRGFGPGDVVLMRTDPPVYADYIH